MSSEKDPELPSFDQELSRILAPLSFLFADGPQKTTHVGDDPTTSSIDQGTVAGKYDPVLDGSCVTSFCSDELLHWQAKMENSLENGKESIYALTLVKRAVESLGETLKCIEEDYRHQQQAASKHSSDQHSGEGTTSVVPLKDEMSDLLTRCLERMDRIYKEVENPNLDVNSTRFGVLVQELHDNSTSLRSFPLAPAVREAHNRRISFAYDRLHILLRDTIQSCIEKSTRSSSSALHTAASKLLASLPNVPTPPADSILNSAEDSAIRVEKWTVAFSSINNFFLEKMEESAALRRLLEFVGKDIIISMSSTSSGAPPVASSLENSLTPLFDSYIRHRTSYLSVMLRWWSQHDHGTSSVEAKHFTEISSIPSETTAHSQTAALDRDSKLMVTESGNSSSVTQGMLPRFAEEMVFILEAFMQLEKGVVDRVWLRDDYGLAILPQMHSVISETAYSVFRSSLLSVDDVHELSKTVEIIEGVRVYCSKRKWLKLADLWVRMTQDTQERLIFRASMYLRQHLAGRTPTKEWGQKYLLLYDETVKESESTSSTDTSATKTAPPPLEYFSTFPLTVDLLEALHRTLSSDIFSVLAEESIRLCLTQVSQLNKVMRTLSPHNEPLALLAELAHLQFLHHHLASLDANITVVEKKLDLRQSLRFRKIKIIESSRESMQSVENQFADCYQKLVETLTKSVSSPAESAGKTDAAKHAIALAEVQKLTSMYECLLLRFIPDPWLRAKILLPVYQFVESYKG